MNYTIRNLVVALVLAVAGIGLMSTYLRGERADLERGKESVTVLVAAKDIPAGTRGESLEDGGYLEERDVLREDAPPQAIARIRDVTELTLNTAVFTGEVLTAPKFERGSGLNPSNSIKGDQRLMALPIGPYQRVADMLKPGDHVDVLASSGDGSAAARWVAARDVVIVQTPDSMVRAATGEEAEAAGEVTADADSRVYVVQVSDKVAGDLLWSLQAADQERGLTFLLRGSSGPSETELPLQRQIPDVS